MLNGLHSFGCNVLAFSFLFKLTEHPESSIIQRVPLPLLFAPNDINRWDIFDKNLLVWQLLQRFAQQNAVIKRWRQQFTFEANIFRFQQHAISEGHFLKRFSTVSYTCVVRLPAVVYYSKLELVNGHSWLVQSQWPNQNCYKISGGGGKLVISKWNISNKL